jgi:hypothetical protein
MKTRVWLPLIFLVLMINLTWVLKFDLNNKEYRRRMNDSHNKIIEMNRELSMMNRSWRYAIRSNGQHLPSTLQVQSKDGTSYILDNYLSLSEKLILVVSDRHCSSCVDQLLFTMKNEITGSKRDHLLILYSEQDHAYEKWRQRQAILTGVEFLEISGNGLQLPMDSLEVPYFLMAGADLTANLTYAPFPSLEEQTKEYLDLIANRFFN